MIHQSLYPAIKQHQASQPTNAQNKGRVKNTAQLRCAKEHWVYLGRTKQLICGVASMSFQPKLPSALGLRGRGGGAPSPAPPPAYIYRASVHPSMKQQANRKSCISIKRCITQPVNLMQANQPSLSMTHQPLCSFPKCCRCLDCVAGEALRQQTIQPTNKPTNQTEPRDSAFSLNCRTWFA